MQMKLHRGSFLGCSTVSKYSTYISLSSPSLVIYSVFVHLVTGHVHMFFGCVPTADLQPLVRVSHLGLCGWVALGPVLHGSGSRGGADKTGHRAWDPSSGTRGEDLTVIMGLNNKGMMGEFRLEHAHAQHEHQPNPACNMHLIIDENQGENHIYGLFLFLAVSACIFCVSLPLTAR